jgi:hypothetical protein
LFVYAEYIEHDTWGVDVDGDGRKEIRADGLQVMDEDRNILFDWSLYENDPNAEPATTYGALSEWWSNCNSVSFIADAGWSQGSPLTGEIYLNCRVLNRLYKIAYPEGSIEWVMGTNGDFGEGIFYHSHDPEITAVTDDQGRRIATRFLIYDNHEGPPMGEVPACPEDETCPPDIEPYSRIIELEVDEQLDTAILFKWPSPTSPDFDQVRFYSPLAGGVATLPGGNLLVTNGTEGGIPLAPFYERTNGRLLEIRRDGTLTGAEVVWEVRLPDYYGTFEAIRLPAEAMEGWVSTVKAPGED